MWAAGQYWTRNKLAIHLRDSPQCVQTLRGHGCISEATSAGLGSRQWRAREVEDFTLAVPEAQGTPLPPRDGDEWDTVCEDAYKEVCHALLQHDLPGRQAAILHIFHTIAAKYPLYFNEVVDVVERSAAEAREVWESANNEFWTQQTYEAICAAASGFADAHWPVGDSEKDEAVHAVTLHEFSSAVAKFDWNQISQVLCGHETRESVPVFLPASWEATWEQSSGTLDFVAVTQSYWPVLPAELRAIWELALSGERPSITAPDTFWRHPLSLPFRQWAVNSASN